MPRLIALLLILFGLAAPAWAGDFEEGLAVFRRAAELRERQGLDSPESKALFREAARTWERVADSGTTSTELLTNIGNARAFAGDLGPAVLAYRRALVLAPENDRAGQSLASVRIGLGLDRDGESASTGLVRALFFWHRSLSLTTRKILFAVCWMAAWVLVLASRKRRRLRFPAVLSLLVGAAFLVSLAVGQSVDGDGEPAVLLTRSEGRTGDGDFYSTSHTTPLPAGAELTILERRDSGWVRGRLRDGAVTWLPASAVESVIP